MPAKPHPAAEIGAALQWLRLQSGLHQREILDRLAESGRSVSVVWLSQVENGRRQPSAPLVHQLLDVYGCSDAQLTELLDERPWHAPPVVQTPLPRRESSGAADVAGVVYDYLLLPPDAQAKVRQLLHALRGSPTTKGV